MNIFNFIVIILFYSSFSIKTQICSISKSLSVFYIIKDIKEYYADRIILSNKCFLNNQFKEFEELYELHEYTKRSLSLFKCNKCPKAFKKKEFLMFHYNLFHLDSKNDMCLADICLFLNCDKLMTYYDINLGDTLKEESFGECDQTMEQEYSKQCMNIVKGCFRDDDDYNHFFENFCSKIKCESKNVMKESATWDVLKRIFLIFVTICAFIYVLIVYISHYT